LQTFSAQPDGVWQEDARVLTTLEWFNGQGAEIQVDSKSDVGGDDGSAGNGTSAADKALRDVLYNVENLRKRPGAED
jgi:tRNA (guanine-N(7)-)-methyltransferase subunit TRM82